MCMRIPPGLLPKEVTSVSDAAYAGRAAGTARPIRASDVATASSGFRLIFMLVTPLGAEVRCTPDRRGPGGAAHGETGGGCRPGIRRPPGARTPSRRTRDLPSASRLRAPEEPAPAACPG